MKLYRISFWSCMVFCLIVFSIGLAVGTEQEEKSPVTPATEKIDEPKTVQKTPIGSESAETAVAEKMAEPEVAEKSEETADTLPSPATASENETDSLKTEPQKEKKSVQNSTDTLTSDSVSVAKKSVAEDTGKDTTKAVQAEETADTTKEAEDEKPVEVASKEKKDKKSEDYSGDNTGVALFLGIGSNGIDLFLVKSLQEYFKIKVPIQTRLGVSYFKFRIATKQTISDRDFDLGGSPRLFNISLLFDVMPFKKVLRLSTGMVVNLNKIEMEFKNLDPLNFNDVLITAEEMGDFTATLTYPPVALYLGLGFGNSLKGNRVQFLFDLGFIYFGKPRIDMEGSGLIKSTEEKADAIEEILGEYSIAHWYPRLSFILSFLLGGN